MSAMARFQQMRLRAIVVTKITDSKGGERF
ncbi:hypothetical protein SBA5_1410007 [Candidatus Sulfotelmatomonas gaucii]|uniref:Uncharacterized protein n=1 Tax=Candidatus Sulfuritelmatomonas gaucii TaxID=2043161 RepID=A0A2N9L4T3_9BACT|nr:hypothetical protein SBA5_1410007 [Candidatus Sulfotelmatomonas gaucii]